MEKERYQQPKVELINLRRPLHILVNFSSSGEIGDWGYSGESPHDFSGDGNIDDWGLGGDA